MRLSKLLPFAALAASLPTGTQLEPRRIVDTSQAEVYADGYDNPYECFDRGIKGVNYKGQLIFGDIEKACTTFRAQRWKKGTEHNDRVWHVWFNTLFRIKQINGPETVGSLDMDFETCVEEFVYLFMKCPHGGWNFGEKFEFFADPDLVFL